MKDVGNNRKGRAVVNHSYICICAFLIVLKLIALLHLPVCEVQTVFFPSLSVQKQSVGRKLY